ncbi:MAG: ATP-binding protein, partial [Candidatus Aenigmatarchaeota archaeon]
KGFFFFVSGSIISKDQIPAFNKSAKDIDPQVKVKYGIDYIEKNADEDFPVALLTMVYTRLQSPYDLRAEIEDPLPLRPMSKPADISFLNGGVNDFETRLKMGLRILKDLLSELPPSTGDAKALERVEAVLSRMSQFFEFGNVDRDLPFNARAHNYKGRIFYVAGYLLPQIRKEIELLSPSNRIKLAKFIKCLDNLNLTMSVAANYMLRLLRLSAAVGNISMPLTFGEFIRHTVDVFLSDYGENVTIERDFDKSGLAELEIPYGLTFVVSYILDNALEQYQIKYGREFKGKIYFRVNKKQQVLEILIIDEAGGIPEDILPKIFLRKFTTKPQGSGYGLFWTRKLVGMFGGTISAANEKKGARFTIQLPLDWKRIVEEAEQVPDELLQRVFQVLRERGIAGSDELAEIIAREISIFSRKIAAITKTRETITHETYIMGGNEKLKVKIWEALPRFFEATCNARIEDFRDIILEKGTTQQDIENLLLSLLALRKVEGKEDIAFTYLPTRQAVVIGYDVASGEARILLRSRENLEREGEGITPERRERYQRALRQIGYAIHKLGAEIGNMSAVFYALSMKGKISKEQSERLERLYRQELPEEVYGAIHTYTSSSGQFTGFEDDILIVERVDGWIGAISDLVQSFVNARERVEKEMEGVTLEEGSFEKGQFDSRVQIVKKSQILLRLLYHQRIEDKEFVDLTAFPGAYSQLHGREQFHFSVVPNTRLWLEGFFLENIMLNAFRCKTGKDTEFYVSVSEENGYTIFHITYKGHVDSETMFTPKQSKDDPWYRGPLVLDLVEAVDGEITAHNVGDDVQMVIRFPLPPGGGRDGMNAYPLSVPEAAQRQAEQAFGKHWTSQAFTLKDLQDKRFPEGLSKEQAAVFLERLNELLEAITKTGPPEFISQLKETLPLIKFYLSNDPKNLRKDPKTSLPYIASAKIKTRKAYFHVVDFFNQSPAKQLEIQYHEVGSHITKGIEDEAEAMRDTALFVETCIKQKPLTLPFN